VVMGSMSDRWHWSALPEAKACKTMWYYNVLGNGASAYSKMIALLRQIHSQEKGHRIAL